MSNEKPSVWLIIVSLLMLFVSGAWTVASILPFVPKDVRASMRITVTAANVSFLLTLLAAMLLYLEVGPKQNLKKAMMLTFSIGIITLIISVILFTASFLITPIHYPDYFGSLRKSP
jgi:hypothetical protein